MKKDSGTIIYSPSDLIRYLASPFGSWLDRYRLEGLGEIKPDEQTEEEKLLSRTGDEHEQSVLKRYKTSGTGLIEIPKDEQNSTPHTLRRWRQSRRRRRSFIKLLFRTVPLLDMQIS